MAVAAFVTIVIAISGGQAPNWEIFLGIIVLLFINLIIGFIAWWQSKNLLKAFFMLYDKKAKVKRDGEWRIMNESDLVPGDIIAIKHGNYISTDGRIIGKIHHKFDTSKVSMPIHQGPFIVIFFYWYNNNNCRVL